MVLPCFWAIRFFFNAVVVCSCCSNGRIRKEYEIDTIHHVRVSGTAAARRRSLDRIALTPCPSIRQVYPSEDGPGQSNLTLHQTAVSGRSLSSSLSYALTVS